MVLSGASYDLSHDVNLPRQSAAQLFLYVMGGTTSLFVPPFFGKGAGLCSLRVCFSPHAAMYEVWKS